MGIKAHDQDNIDGLFSFKLVVSTNLHNLENGLVKGICKARISKCIVSDGFNILHSYLDSAPSNIKSSTSSAQFPKN